LTTTYSYDADGRRTSSGSTTETWNAANQLTGFTNGSGTTTYTYDGDGNRVSATSGSSVTGFSYDINNLLPALALETAGNGSELDRYITADGLLLAVHTNGSDYYIAHDTQGSVIGMTSATGATEAKYSYDPFGNLRSMTKTDPNAPTLPLGFEALLLDPTGLYHLGARQLDTTTGSFLSQDPLPGSSSQPAASSYIYAYDQPTVLWDPSGMCADATDAYISSVESTYFHNQGVVMSLATSESQSIYGAYAQGGVGWTDIPGIVTAPFKAADSLEQYP
jgi:RHS repeat-associated protein